MSTLPKLGCTMRLPYFAMYPSDFEAKTSHLTLAEDGAYNRLLRITWMTPGCTIPDDHDWIMRRLRCGKAEFESVVLGVLNEFFTRKNGRISNAKLTRIFVSSGDAHSKRVLAGKHGAQAKALKTLESSTSNAKAMLKQPEPEPEPEPYRKVREAKASCAKADHFPDFWAAYPHRNGEKKNRKGAEAAFLKALKVGTAEQIAAGIEAMRNAPDVLRGFARDPTTWLNQQGWQDEHQPTLTAINGGHYETTGTIRPIPEGRGNRPDPALAQISRLAGLRPS